MALTSCSTLGARGHTWHHAGLVTGQRRAPGAGVTRVTGQPVVTAVRPPRKNQAAMSFIGLVEAYALTA